MKKFTYRVYVIEKLRDGQWTPKELRVSTVRCVLRDITEYARDPNTYRVRRVNSEEEMCRIIDLKVTTNPASVRLTSTPSQLEWVS